MLLLVRLVAAGTGGHASPDGLVMGAVKDEDGLSTRSVPTVSLSTDAVTWDEGGVRDQASSL